MHLILIPNPGQILDLFRSFELLSTLVADSKLIGPLVDKWEHRGAVDPGQQQTNIRAALKTFSRHAQLYHSYRPIRTNHPCSTIT